MSQNNNFTRLLIRLHQNHAQHATKRDVNVTLRPGGIGNVYLQDSWRITQEAELGARCVAAPVHDFSGYIAAGISVSGPVIRMSRTRTNEIANSVKRAALEISRQLGYANRTSRSATVRS